MGSFGLLVSILLFLHGWLVSSVPVSNSDPGPLAVSMVNTKNETSKIYQGSETSTYPFFVSIVKKDLHESSFDHYCGASLIDSTHILTAAHCTDFMPSFVRRGSIFAVWIGPVSVKPAAYRQKISITLNDVHQHWDFSMQTIMNDIAVITLPTPVVQNAAVSTICIARLKNYTNLDVTLTGFGTTECHTQSNVPRYATGTIMDPEQCRKYWGSKIQNNVCSYLVNAEGEYAQQAGGDSGGPLFAVLNNNGEQVYAQVGIVSFDRKNETTNCPRREFPGVYCNPGRYTTFLQTYANPTFCDQI